MIGTAGPPGNEEITPPKGNPMNIITRKSLAAAACSVALLGAAACGSSSDDSGSASDTSSSSSDESSSTPSASADPAANLVGAGCAAYAKQVPDGAGSVGGMAQDPVGTAATNNPLLTTLTAAVSGKVNPAVNLVDTLNDPSAKYTVFAPVDDAFKPLAANGTVKKLAGEKGGKTLSAVLTYHVLSGELQPTEIDGKHKSLQGNEVTVKGEGDNITVNGSKVICGGVQTSNAVVYLIPNVLNPAGGHF